MSAYYHRSIPAAQIICGSIKLDARDFHHLILATTRCALELKKSSGSSHGDLKPLNIFVGPGKGCRAKVALSDPIAATDSNPRHTEIADLHALGDLIYQLVRGEEVSGAARWPLKMTPEWSVIFRHKADDWLKLCDDLLDPTDAHIETMTLEDLEAKLIELQPKTLVSTRGAVTASIAVGAVVVAIGGALLFSHRAVKNSQPAADDSAKRDLNLANATKAQEQKYQTALKDGVALEARANDQAALKLARAQPQSANSRLTNGVPPTVNLARLDERLALWEVQFKLKGASPGKNVQSIKLSDTIKDWLLKEVEKMESLYQAGGRLPDKDLEKRLAELRRKIEQ